MKVTRDDIQLIPAVARVLVEYEKLYDKKSAREMFDLMIDQIVNKINNDECENIKKDINGTIKSLYDVDGKVKDEIAEKFADEAINWGDLKCLEVKKCYVAYIDEADPNAENFKDYIKNEMEKKGYNDIEIITEW